MESVVNHSISNFYRDKRVFVTGHTGFKGTWFVKLLYDLGAEVKGYALTPTYPNSFFDEIQRHIKIDSVIEDIRNKERLQAELVSFKPDFVFHLAAQALVRISYQNPSETFDINVVGTANILEGVRSLHGKCTVIIITTDKVYENYETDHFYTEEDRLGGHDPYSASKAAAELVVSSFRNSFFKLIDIEIHQKSVASARAGNVIGGGDNSLDRIVPDIIRSLRNNIPIEVRNPLSVRPWQHVLEPLVGYLKLGMLLDKDVVKYSGAYNFGPLPQDHLPVKSLVEQMISNWGSGTWINASKVQQPHEAGLLKLNIEKANSWLDWQPKLSCTRAIEWTVNWFKQNPRDIYSFTDLQIKEYLML